MKHSTRQSRDPISPLSMECRSRWRFQDSMRAKRRSMRVPPRPTGGRGLWRYQRLDSSPGRPGRSSRPSSDHLSNQVSVATSDWRSRPSRVVINTSGPQAMEEGASPCSSVHESISQMMTHCWTAVSRSSVTISRISLPTLASRFSRPTPPNQRCSDFSRLTESPQSQT